MYSLLMGSDGFPGGERGDSAVSRGIAKPPMSPPRTPASDTGPIRVRAQGARPAVLVGASGGANPDDDGEPTVRNYD